MSPSRLRMISYGTVFDCLVTGIERVGFAGKAAIQPSRPPHELDPGISLHITAYNVRIPSSTFAPTEDVGRADIFRLTLGKVEIVNPFECQEAAKNRFELGHLFLAVERHQFPRNRTRSAAQKSPAVPQSQCQTADNKWLFRHSVGDPEPFPHR